MPVLLSLNKQEPGAHKLEQKQIIYVNVWACFVSNVILKKIQVV